MSNAKLLTILRRHAIPAGYWPEMRALVHDGTRPSSELLRRLATSASMRPRSTLFLLRCRAMQVQISAKRHNAPQGKLNKQTATMANGQGREGFLFLAVFFWQLRSSLPCLHRGDRSKRRPRPISSAAPAAARPTALSRSRRLHAR